MKKYLKNLKKALPFIIILSIYQVFMFGIFIGFKVLSDNYSQYADFFNTEINLIGKTLYYRDIYIISAISFVTIGISFILFYIWMSLLNLVINRFKSND